MPVILLVLTVQGVLAGDPAGLGSVTQGMSRAELVAAVGEPTGRMRMGSKVVLTFADGEVELLNDRVLSVRRNAGPRPAAPVSAAPPPPAVPTPPAVTQAPAQAQALPVTMAHEILRMEARFGARAQHEAALNGLLQRARKTLPAAPVNPGGQDARKCLESVQGFLKKEGFLYRPTAFLFEALETKNTDCDTSTLLYCAIGEAMGYPIGAVVLPRHAFVRWALPHGNVVNWETTETNRNASFSDGSYYEWLLKGMTGEGCNLKTLTRAQLPTIHHYMAGLAFASVGRFGESLKEHDAALKLDKTWYLSRMEKCAVNMVTKSYAAGANESLQAMEYLPVDELGQVSATAVAFAVIENQDQDVDRKQLGRVVDGFMRRDVDNLGYVVLNAMDAYLNDRASSAAADVDGACSKWPTNFVPFLCRGAMRVRGGAKDLVRQDFATALKLLDGAGVKRTGHPLRSSAVQREE